MRKCLKKCVGHTGDIELDASVYQQLNATGVFQPMSLRVDEVLSTHSPDMAAKLSSLEQHCDCDAYLQAEHSLELQLPYIALIMRCPAAASML